MNETWEPQIEADARTVLSGLTPTRDYAAESRSHLKDTGAFSGNLLSTMPILLAGSMAVSMTFTGAVTPVSARPAIDPNASNGPTFGNTSATRSATAGNRHTQRVNNLTSSASAEPAPTIYTVVAGDTVGDIAARYGLSTASVLALNGLGWKSKIFPGQTLRLTSATAATPRATVEEHTLISITRYTIVRGDTISHIAERFGVPVSSVLEANDLTPRSLIFPGQTIVIPVSADANPAPVLATEAFSAARDPLAPVLPLADQVRSDASMALPDSSNPTSSTTDLGTAPRSDSSTGEHGSGGQATTKKPTAKNDENPAAPTPVKTDPPASTSGTYTIRPGDTLSKIAKSLGVTVSALCAANGLTISSVIYAGKKLAIPGGASTGGADSGGSTPANAGANVTLLTAEGEANARTIISIGRELGVSEYGIVIALATAMQESTMRNLNYGHLDSVGLFQQRPASGWGTAAQLTTPTHAARLFYGGPQNPNKGKTRGLLDIAGWQSMTLTQAAQKVQISGHPTAYAKWEASARYWLKTL